MNIKKTQTETYVIPDPDKLDSVTVYVTNYKLGQGKVVIECFGEAWAHYWSAMGDRTLQEFFITSDNDYLVSKLIRGDVKQTDFDEINEIAEKRGYDICVTSDIEIAMQAGEMAKCFGEDWCMDLPRCYTNKYRYLSRIVTAVKAALSEDKKALEVL
ncbi:MAG: hypothetical protein P8Y45_08560 [Exilibacterium sp.]